MAQRPQQGAGLQSTSATSIRAAQTWQEVQAGPLRSRRCWRVEGTNTGKSTLKETLETLSVTPSIKDHRKQLRIPQLFRL